MIVYFARQRVGCSDSSTMLCAAENDGQRGWAVRPAIRRGALNSLSPLHVIDAPRCIPCATGLSCFRCCLLNFVPRSVIRTRRPTGWVSFDHKVYRGLENEYSFLKSVRLRLASKIEKGHLPKSIILHMRETFVTDYVIHLSLHPTSPNKCCLTDLSKNTRVHTRTH